MRIITAELIGGPEDGSSCPVKSSEDGKPPLFIPFITFRANPDYQGSLQTSGVLNLNEFCVHYEVKYRLRGLIRDDVYAYDFDPNSWRRK